MATAAELCTPEDAISPPPDVLQARIELLVKRMAHGQLSSDERRELAELLAKLRGRRSRLF